VNPYITVGFYSSRSTSLTKIIEQLQDSGAHSLKKTKQNQKNPAVAILAPLFKIIKYLKYQQSNESEGNVFVKH